MKQKFSIIYFLIVLCSINVGLAQNEQDKKHIQETQKLVDAYKDEGITGSNHEKYSGKVVFDSKAIGKERMNLLSTVFKNEFKIGEFVYARVFLNKAAVKYLLNNWYGINERTNKDGINESTFLVLLYIDNKPIQINLNGRSWENEGITLTIPSVNKSTAAYISTFEFGIFKNEDGGTPEHLVNQINNLAEGNHSIKVEVYGRDKFDMKRTNEPIAAGEFTLVVDGKGKLKYGKTFESVKAEMVDEKLTKELFVACQESKHSKLSKPIKIKIASQWEYGRSHGVIIRRGIRAKVLCKNDKGDCGYYLVQFEQMNNGGSYDKMTVSNVQETPTPLDCIE